MVSSELQAAIGLVYGRLRGLRGGQDHCTGRQQFSFLPMCFSCHYEGSRLTSASLPVSKKHLSLAKISLGYPCWLEMHVSKLSSMYSDLLCYFRHQTRAAHQCNEKGITSAQNL